MSPLAINLPQGGELIVLLFIVLLLFGAKRLPEMGRSLGKGIREFKEGTKNIAEDHDEPSDAKAEQWEQKSAGSAEPPSPKDP